MTYRCQTGHSHRTIAAKEACEAKAPENRARRIAAHERRKQLKGLLRKYQLLVPSGSSRP
jgi:hypothetical protein